MFGHFSEEYFLEYLGDIKVKANEGYNPGDPGYINSVTTTLFPEEEHYGPCYIMLYIDSSYDLDEAEECVEAGEIDSWEYWHHTKRARLLETIKTFVPQGLKRVFVYVEG